CNMIAWPMNRSKLQLALLAVFVLGFVSGSASMLLLTRSMYRGLRSQLASQIRSELDIDSWHLQRAKQRRTAGEMADFTAGNLEAAQPFVDRMEHLAFALS